jgi:cyclase
MDDVKAMQHFMESLVSYVDSGIKAGKSKEEILTAKAIPRTGVAGRWY